MGKNPKIVTNSIIDAAGSKTDTNSIQIYPITIFRYAWLERLNSPFIDPNQKFAIETVIPTAYVFCSKPEELRKYTSADVEKFKNDAFAWSDKYLKLDDIPELIKNITQQMQDLNKAAPDAVPDSSVSDDGAKKKS